MSRSRTTRSASFPGSSVPVSPSRKLTYAEPAVNAPERGRHVERLLRQERLLIARLGRDPRHGDLELLEGVGSGHGPVAAEGKAGSCPEQSAERVHAGRALRADERHRQLVDVAAAARPQGRDVGDDAELREARKVVRVDELEMGEVVARVAPAVRALGGLDRVEGVADSPIPDRVHVHLEAVRVQEDDRVLQLLGGEHRNPVVVRADVRLEQRAGEVLEHAVVEDLRAGIRRRPCEPSAWSARSSSSCFSPRVRFQRRFPSTRMVSSSRPATAL